MKNLSVCLLVILSFSAFGQYSEYYKGTKVVRAIPNDSVIIGARYENSVGGKAGIQMIQSGDTAEIYLGTNDDSQVGITTRSKYITNAFDTSMRFLMYEAVGGQVMRSQQGYDSEFSTIVNLTTLEGDEGDTILAGYANVGDLFGAGFPFFGRVMQSDSDTGSILLMELSAQIISTMTDDYGWSLSSKTELVDFLSGMVSSRKFYKSLFNSSLGSFDDGYFATINLSDESLKISQKDSSSSEAAITIQDGSVEIGRIDRQRIKKSYPNEGFFPATAYVNSSFTLDTTICLDCYASGLRVDHRIQDADGDTMSANSGSFYTNTMIDSGVVIPTFYDWRASVNVDNGSHIDFGAVVFVNSDTANSGTATKLAGYYVNQLEGDTVYGFYMDDEFVTTSSGRAYGLYIDSDVHNHIKTHLHIGDGTATATDVSLDLNATDKAMLLNRLTTAERDALTPVNGMIIYNTTTGQTEAYESGSWVDL